MRSLEWSVAEYGTNGLNMVPIMPAGSKNLWGAPYVQFEISTKDYSDIYFTAYMAGSKKCPASWKMQYSLDGETFTDIENAVATIESSKRKLMTPYLHNVALPSAINNQEKVILRLVPVSNTTVNGGTTEDDPTGGELALNNILISGTKSSTPLLGDVDKDGLVTVMDATCTQRFLVHKYTIDETDTWRADVDKNGDITIMDATLIQRLIASIIEEF